MYVLITETLFPLLMKTPVIVINFKVYAEVLGLGGLELALICDSVAKESGASIVVAPASTDLSLIASKVNTPVFAQHFDIVQQGSNTGYVPLEAVKKAGARGSLLNHSERKVPLGDLKEAVRLCKASEMESIVCADTIDEIRKVADLHPDYVAIEPPELIGGDISVTDAKPDVISQAVEAIHAIDKGVGVLCGAGVKNGRDVSKALSLGSEGVLLASGVVKAKNRREVLIDLVSGLSMG